MKTIKTIAAILAMCPIFAASGAMDATAYLRSLGSSAYFANRYDSNTESLAATPFAQAFDGAGIGEFDGHLLFTRLKSGSTSINPCDVRLFVYQGRSATLNAFTVYRLHTSEGDGNNKDVDYIRSPKRFKLLGSNDGTSWDTLYETTSDVVWNAETLSNRFEIAESARRPYSQYRFALDLTTASNRLYSASYSSVDTYGYNEVVLEGVMMLSWTGGASGTWSALDANWSDGAASIGWQPSAMAVFGGGNTVTVGDALSVGGIRMKNGGASSISGGTLAMESPAWFDISNATTIASTICDAGAVDSTMRFDLSGKTSVLDKRSGSCLPRSDSNENTGKSVLCWTNRKLADVVSVASSGFYNKGTVLSSSINNFSIDSRTAAFQVQAFNGTTRYCVKVELSQVGQDIWGRAVYAKYRTGTSFGETTDFDLETINVYSAAIRDDDHTTVGFGVYNICLDFRDELQLNGAFSSERDLVVNGGTLAFGASSLTLGQDVSGTGTLKFSPANGSQTVAFDGSCGCDGGMILSGAATVAVTDAVPFASGMPLAMEDGATLSVSSGSDCTVGAASFSGTTTIAVANGATVSIDSVSFSEGAVVNLILSGSACQGGVRIGTSASLTSEELAHFIANGRPVKAQMEDGWLDGKFPGLVITFK
jgi:hypothetical protein